MITIAWTPAALVQLHNFHLTQQGTVFVQNHTQNWILGNAAGWGLNTQHQRVDGTSGATITALVVAVNGANKTVHVISMV